MPECFLAAFSETACSGQLRKVHLIPKQRLKRRGHDPWDERAWVWACGGPWPGLAGHHGEFDGYRLPRIPRERLPEPFLALLDELGVSLGSDRRFVPENGP